MVISPGPYIVLRRISLNIWDCKRLPSKYFGLHHIPINTRKFKTDRLSDLYYVIITQQRVDTDNKRLGGFGDPPSTHPLSEVLGGVSNIINFDKYWKDLPITNHTHSFSNRTDLYQLILPTPLKVALCRLLIMNQIAFSFTSEMIYIYIYISLYHHNLKKTTHQNQGTGSSDAYFVGIYCPLVPD